MVNWERSKRDTLFMCTVHGHTYSSPSIFLLHISYKTTFCQKKNLKLSLRRFLWTNTQMFWWCQFQGPFCRIRVVFLQNKICPSWWQDTFIILFLYIFYFSSHIPLVLFHDLLLGSCCSIFCFLCSYLLSLFVLLSFLCWP
jgi:hypothetical protein